MDRRPSVISVSSLGSISGLLKPGQLNTLTESPSQAHPQNGTSVPIPRKLSVNGTIEHASGVVEGEHWDPDDLFTKHTVAEVKVIQQRLRSDADAKQEELRLMVGERYRDLLQASTSIISIAESSSRVESRLEYMRRVALSAESVTSPKATLSRGDDSDLHSLQSLAAHMKLLLDAPEHLWRLLERKMYLYAAWLFLLSRVVHRSLLRDHDEDEVAWASSGIDINEQFPLVQRQWDAVSQFRSQITHKATLSLREASLTPVEVCSTLLTLHLLESRPLHETLATLLAQRTRTLTSALTEDPTNAPNGGPHPGPGTSGRSRKVVIRGVRQKLKAVLEVISRTLGTARTIFVGTPGESASLMQDVLQFIHSDSPQSSSHLPADLRLTSQSLLSSLPSSNHFLLLPSNVRLYKPYVDEGSLSAPATAAQFLQKLDEWFQKALNQVQRTLAAWFADLTSVREVWKIRQWASAWLRATEGLQPGERAALNGSLDTVCHQRAAAVWKLALTSMASGFSDRLEDSLSRLASSQYDTHPVEYLFRAPPVPRPQASNLSAARAAFEKYRSTLQQQVACRTPLLDETLSAIEGRVTSLHEDVEVIYQGESSSPELIEQYRGDAGVLCTAITDVLQRTLNDQKDESEDAMRNIAFVGHIAKALSTSSVLLDRVGCEPHIFDDFRQKLSVVAEHSAHRWRDHIVSDTLSNYWGFINIAQDVNDPRPSSALVACLIDLADATQQIGASADASQQRKWALSILTQFVEQLLLGANDRYTDTGGHAWFAWDLCFLLQIALSWDPELAETVSALRSRVADVAKEHPEPVDMSECLSRMQHLLGVLLPVRSQTSANKTKTSGLLQLGLPSTETSIQPTVQLVKPSARFGLLLVGSSFSR